ncbi:ankyrin repeat, SAM and basic leucine zipper domain-containing protein 1 [Antennarius striatus]|uniref:ankyrin repeat, SAM and basic leucine zipper domain-containing protein 1 n=1 Tax=Antennarius striatus TaxID=241820 RepID=UPI0035AE0398
MESHDVTARRPHGRSIPDDVPLDVTTFTRAVSEGDVRTVEQLLDGGVAVETPLVHGGTALMRAVSAANFTLAKVLLDRGASANDSKDDITALMACIRASAGEDKICRCVELLLSRQADLNTVNSFQMTALMLAAMNGYCKVIDLLVFHGAEIDTQGANGCTALSLAVQFGHEEAVLKLLHLGADKTIKTKNGQSLLDLAAMSQHTQLERILDSSAPVSAAPPVEQNPPQVSESSCVTGRVCDDLWLLLHGLQLGHLVDVVKENGITWSILLTMEEEDLQKLGVADAAERRQLLAAVQLMRPNKVDLDTIAELVPADSGTEELLTFLVGVKEQCCSLSEMLQEVIRRFPTRSSQLVFSLDPQKRAQAACSQLVVQTRDLQKDVICLHNLIVQTNTADDCPHPPAPGSHGDRWPRVLTGVAVGIVGALILWRATAPTPTCS